MIEAKNIEGKYLSYQGRPLVRQENELFLGDLSKDYVYMLIMSYKDNDKKDTKIADKVMVQLSHGTDPKPEKQTMADGLSDALDTGMAWLERCSSK